MKYSAPFIFVTLAAFCYILRRSEACVKSKTSRVDPDPPTDNINAGTSPGAQPKHQKLVPAKTTPKTTPKTIGVKPPWWSFGGGSTTTQPPAPPTRSSTFRIFSRAATKPPRANTPPRWSMWTPPPQWSASTTRKMPAAPTKFSATTTKSSTWTPAPPSSKSSWTEWSPWSECPTAGMMGRDCPLVQNRKRFCLRPPCSEDHSLNTVGDTLTRICSRGAYAYCTDLYLHRRYDGSCNLGPDDMPVSFIVQPSICSDACNQDTKCAGFTYDPIKSKCYLSKSMCPTSAVRTDRAVVSYRKIVPEGFKCSLSECYQARTDNRLITVHNNIRSADECAFRCRQTSHCRSFMWGTSLVMIKNNVDSLDCYLFNQDTCSIALVSSRSRFCVRQ